VAARSQWRMMSALPVAGIAHPRFIVISAFFT
jgi:hypothetical protein